LVGDSVVAGVLGDRGAQRLEGCVSAGFVEAFAHPAGELAAVWPRAESKLYEEPKKRSRDREPGRAATGRLPISLRTDTRPWGCVAHSCLFAV